MESALAPAKQTTGYVIVDKDGKRRQIDPMKPLERNSARRQVK
jgi:hypothetical protein